jgi:hypothetical protein
MAINEPSETALRVYPNPAGNYVVFELVRKETVGTVTITEITGRPVTNFPLSGEKTVWETKGIKPGVYLYRLQTHEWSSSGKLMIKP